MGRTGALDALGKASMARVTMQPKIPGMPRPVVRCERCGLTRRSLSEARAMLPAHRCEHGRHCVDAEEMPTLACEECIDARAP